MKILVLCYEYPPVGGGGGRVAANVAAELVKRGHEVRVVTARVGDLPSRDRVNGVDVIRSHAFRRSADTCSVPEMALYVAAGLLPALREARRWKPDVAHAHFAVPSGAVAWPVSLLTGVPLVLTAHLGDVPGGVPEQTESLFRLVNPIARLIWRHARAVTTVSRHVAGLARAAYGIECRVIPNGMPARAPTPPRVNNPRQFIFAGRLSVQKNPLLALRALARTSPNWKLDVIGDGPLGPEMRAEARRLNLSDRVTFHGWLPADAVSARMASADVLLMTSLHEGLPMVAVEALQHGLAIVGSAIGGMTDVVDDGSNGYLCPLDAAAFANRLDLLLSDGSRLGSQREASLRKARAFDLAATVDAYESVLSEVAGLAGAASKSGRK